MAGLFSHNPSAAWANRLEIELKHLLAVDPSGPFEFPGAGQVDLTDSMAITRHLVNFCRQHALFGSSALGLRSPQDAFTALLDELSERPLEPAGALPTAGDGARVMDWGHGYFEKQKRGAQTKLRDAMAE